MMTPPKYPRTLHWYNSQTVHSDDRYHTRPAYFVGREVIITEKLDGGNTCLFNGEVFARSTNQPSHAGWMAMVRKHHAWKTQRDDVAFYGEDLFGIHSIEYDPMPEMQTFRLFAALYLNTAQPLRPGLFADWDQVVTHADELGFPRVPVLYRGIFPAVSAITQWFDTYINQPSQLGGACEGFVMRVADSFLSTEFSQNVCKYVRANHVQTDEHWTRNWKQCRLTDNA